MSTDSLSFARVWIQNRIDNPKTPLSEDEQTLAIVLDLFRALGVAAEREAAAKERATLRRELDEVQTELATVRAMAAAVDRLQTDSNTGPVEAPLRRCPQIFLCRDEVGDNPFKCELLLDHDGEHRITYPGLDGDIAVPVHWGDADLASAVFHRGKRQ